METQKGSSSFNLRLVRVSIDGEDEPIGREATLRLRTQQDHAALLKTNRHLMEIHIDGRLMACWDFSLLKQHPSYQTIHIFSSFAVGKHIHMTLPLPLGSRAAPKNNAACLKAIRVYFSKSQDFHTAINWLSKHAQLIHLNGRPATSNALHSSASDVRKEPACSDDRPPMAFPAHPSVAQDRDQLKSRPQSFSGQASTSQYSEKPPSRSQSRGSQPPAPQHLRQTESRSQSYGPPQLMAHSLGGLRRDSHFRRNLIALQESERSATSLPSISGTRTGNSCTGRVQMPRVVRTLSRTASTAHMGNVLQARYGRPKEDALNVSYSVALDASIGRHSPYNTTRYQLGPLIHEPFQEPHQPSDQYIPTGPSTQVATSRLSQTNAVAVSPTQSTIAPDSLAVDFPEPHTCGTDDSMRHCAMPVERSDTVKPGDSPGQRNSDLQSPEVRETKFVPSSPRTLRKPTHDGSGAGGPPATLFAATGMASQHETDQDTAVDFESSFPRPPSAANRQPLSEVQRLGLGNAQGAPQNSFNECGSDKRQRYTAGQKRRLSAQTGQEYMGKKRKANQSAPMNRAGRPTEPDNGVGGHDSTANDEVQDELAAPAAVVSSWNQGSPAISVAASKVIQMVDHAIQTEPPTRLQVDVLHLSAALELNQRLLQETRQWESGEDHNDRLLRLGTQLVRGLREMFRRT